MLSGVQGLNVVLIRMQIKMNAEMTSIMLSNTRQRRELGNHLVMTADDTYHGPV